MRACRVDANHADIRAALRAVGCGVMDLSKLGDGKPDILVTRIRRGGIEAWWLMELKVAKGRLRAKQVTFAKGWPTTIHVVRSVDEALKLVLA